MDYKKSIYDKELQLEILPDFLPLDIYGNPWAGSMKFTVNLMDFDVYTQDKKDLSDSASNAAIGGLFASILPIIIIGSGPLIMSFLNGAQIINFLKYIDVYYPINV